MVKIDRSYIKKIRYGYQWFLVLLISYGGLKLYLFSEHFISGTRFVKRAPLVEGFLPIGALMSLKLWIYTGFFDQIHPASLVLFTGALAISFFLKKSFCGWVCPIGALSELFFKTGEKIVGKNFRILSLIDYPLRSIKYILLGFFLYIVLIVMSPESIKAFLNTSYWKISDVKMLKFFTDMTLPTMVILAVLSVLSMIYRNFWCRYLCPYGALTGILSFFSPVKINRNETACIHCHKCSDSCPNSLPVESKTIIRSPECNGCLTCISSCPAPDALDMAFYSKKTVNPLIFISLASILFFGIIGAAKLTGHWHSNVDYEDYKELVPNVYKYDHP